MTSYRYQSAFTHDSRFSSQTPNESTTTGDANTNTTVPTTSHDNPALSSDGLATFICHAAYLDNQLQRGDRSAFFASHQARLVNRERIGHGLTFVVERAELEDAPRDDVGPPSIAGSSKQRRRVVVLKTVRADPSRSNRNQWAEVLLEIRALLHEPLRYHPNIVRLLDIRWDGSADTGSPFPGLVMEYATHGTLAHLQHHSRPLPFSVKQKLCYDVGRALSIIHACGMIHGDLKHENILVFENPYNNPPNQPYIAKLSDFGGTIMETSDSSLHVLPMHTFPFEAPELASSNSLSASAARSTDAYSYGMLIWRCMLDGTDLLPLILGSSKQQVKTSSPSAVRAHVTILKNSDAVLESAIASISKYNFPTPSFTTILSALLHTLRGCPSHRALDRAQTRLRGMDAPTAYHYVAVKDEANRKTLEAQGGGIPGRHGINMDSVGFALGRLGNDYDAQNNLPGFRPDLAIPGPISGRFLFEPAPLRGLLEWERQQGMVREFEAFASAGHGRQEGMKAYEAAYFMFQCHVWQFGVDFDMERLCYWLKSAAEPEEEMAETDYWASAWLGRICSALGVANPWDEEAQMENLKLGIMRGHRHCAEDAQILIAASSNERKKETWNQGVRDAKFVWKFLTGGTGMPFFAPRKLSRDWELNNMDVLDYQIKQELGSAYDSCLRATESEEEEDPDNLRFDKIYVNHKGHGLLHMAAVQGKVTALRHIVAKYRCNINLANQSHSDTPLVCACRTAWFDCAMFLIDNGADPNGSSFSEESPLHCINEFEPDQMEVVVQKLVTAGADMEKLTRPSNKDVRGILADWEDSDSMYLTPLGRAVLRRSLVAVKTLLKYGASPTGRPAEGTKPHISPIELAAVLTLPDILEELLRHVSDSEPILEECEMLDKARSQAITPYDSLSLHSRLVRCGVAYKQCLQRTLKILHDRKQPRTQSHPPGKHLCKEIAHNNVDIVETLLGLGHSIEGSPEWRPMRFALMANNTAIFELLTARGPPRAFEEDGHETMLHILAQRHAHAPNHLDIARTLVQRAQANGMDIDASLPGRPSPLALAIQHRFFAFADQLLEQGAGASLNVIHPTQLPSIPGTVTATFLASQLLAPHSSTTLQIISYLSEVHRQGPVKLSPLALRLPSSDTDRNEESDISILHALSFIPEYHMATNQTHITSRILHLVLSMFPPESLDDVAHHPLLQTPITAAILLAAPEVLTAFIEAGRLGDVSGSSCAVEVDMRVVYDRDQFFHGLGIGKDDSEGIPSSPMAKLSLGTPAPDMLVTKTPLTLTQHIVHTVLQLLESKSKEDSGATTWGGIHKLKRHLAVVRILEQHQAGAEDLLEVDERVAKLERDLAMAKSDDQGSDAVAVHHPDGSEEADLPVDLSVLTEERPSGWREGVEMTEEMSLRIFLKHFRAANSGFGDGIVKQMGGMFNKREDGEEA